MGRQPENTHSVNSPSFFTFLTTCFGFYLLIVVGFLSNLINPYKRKQEMKRDGYPPLFDGFSWFYIGYVMRRVQDSYCHIVSSLPGAEIVLNERVSYDNGWTMKSTGTKTKCLNLGSYNYLGFAENEGPCAETAIKAIETYGISTCSSRRHFGTCDLHLELENLVADFLGVEEIITFGMGFATNVLNLPTLLSKGCLVLSDNKNHSSLILGVKLSGATVRVFDHNDINHLESLLQEGIVSGQIDDDYVPWKKILIIVEGIYSMEGTIARLPEIIALKKKYKAYLYLDEAHSIGALGKTGRGVVEYFGCDPRDVDILMGTFTKSFAAVGGYIGGSRNLISSLRNHSFASKYAMAMSPPVVGQIISVMKILMGEANVGKDRIATLARNTKYFRSRLIGMGLVVLGHDDSPVIPFLTYTHSKTAATVRKLLKRKIATVGVGYPAAPLMQARIRICLSAAHTKEQLDFALKNIEDVSDQLGLKYAAKPRGASKCAIL